jgi:hypothetical protein
LARTGRAAGFLAFGAARLTGAFFAGFFAGFLRATGRLAGAFFFPLAFAFFRTAIFSLPAGLPRLPKKRLADAESYSSRPFA